MHWRTVFVARASRPLGRGHPARALGGSGTLPRQRARCPRYARVCHHTLQFSVEADLGSPLEGQTRRYKIKSANYPMEPAKDRPASAETLLPSGTRLSPPFASMRFYRQMSRAA